MLEARSLTKYYGHTAAVRAVSFKVSPGEILGYLGSNGAGKSTTVKMLTGLIQPSEGQIFFNGRSVRDDFTTFQRRLGYVPEEAHLYTHLSGREYLQLVGRLRGIPRRILEPKMDEFLRLFALWNDRHAQLGSYSKGMRQKVLLAAALLHNPDILILDEPFSGLDVSSALVLRDLLKVLAQEKKVILFSSHVLETVEKVCSKVLILRKGEVVAYDQINRLRELMQQPSLEGVFSQLMEVESSEKLVSGILDAMSFGTQKHSSPASAVERKRLDAPVAFGLGVYRSLAAKFPNEFQNAYGDELMQVTEEAIDTICKRDGFRGLARLLLDLAVRVPAEHLAELRQDGKYGVRSLLASPGFTLVVLLSLSLGICVATCAFSEMNGMALRNLPGAQHPADLVMLQSPVSYPMFNRIRDKRDLFSSAMAYAAPVPFAMKVNGDNFRAWGHLISPTYFSTLGVGPALGSIFSDGERSGNETREVIVSYRFWRDHLGADSSVIGKSLSADGAVFTVRAVMPPDFLGASPLLFPADLWMPVSAGRGVAPELAGGALERRDLTMFFVVGRIRPSVPRLRAEVELDAVAEQFEHEIISNDSTPNHHRVLLAEGGKLFPLRKQDLPFFTSFFTVVAGLVMLIACANASNMLLVRATRRRREIAVRLSLGASRWRLVRQLLTESMAISLTAGILGFLGSWWLMTLASQVRMPFPMPVTYDFRPDINVLLLTLGLSILTGIFFGLAPALQATRTDLTSALKEGTDIFYSARRRMSLRNILIVWQVAASITLLVILGLLSVGIQTTLGIEGGFDPKNLYALGLDPVRDGRTAAQAGLFFDRILRRIEAQPGVKQAALTETVPVSLPGSWMRISAIDPRGKRTIGAVKQVVGKNYFETAAIPILNGRSFTDSDETESSPSVIVSRVLAQQLWFEKDPIGRTIEVGNGQVSASRGILPGSFDYRPLIVGTGLERFRVVGVAGDISQGLVVSKPSPAIYFPLKPSLYSRPSLQGVTLLVRAAPGTNGLKVAEHEIAAIDEDIHPINARSMNDQIDQFMAPLRMAGWTYALIGLFGVLLAGVGLAGVTAYSVAQRTREIGIRVALGASRSAVMALVMKQGSALVAVGAVLGLLGAWAGVRMLAFINSSVGTVTSTSTSDPAVLVGAPLLLIFLGLLACYIPATRSTRVDPVAALRHE